jgi:hypothetical protein
MTKADQRKIQKLEIENAELRRMNSRNIEVYGNLIGELITLRSRNEYVNQLLTEALREVAL